MATLLSTETINKIEEILTILDQQPQAEAANRRKKIRVNARLVVDTTLLSTTTRCEMTVFTRNLSTSGVGFVCRRLFKQGELIVLPFKTKNLPPKLVLASVTFCRYIKGGMYEAGAEFLESCDVNPHLKDNIPPHWIQMAMPKEILGARNN